MSIAIGLVGTDGIVLATDSRMTNSTDTNLEYSDDNSQKLWKLTHNLGLTSVGSQQGFRQYLLEICQRTLRKKRVNNLGDKAIKLLTDTIRETFMHQLLTLSETMARELLRTKFAMMIAGYDNDGKPLILSIRAYITASDIPFAPDIRRLYWIDSASGIAEHLLVKTKTINKLRQGLSLSVLKKLVALLIEESKISSNLIGGKIQMATVTRDGGFRFVDEGEIGNITEDANICIANNVNNITEWLNST